MSNPLEDVLSGAGNPNVSGDVLRQAAEIAQQLQRFGLDPLPGYNLAPALGGSIIRKLRTELKVQAAIFGQ